MVTAGTAATPRKREEQPEVPQTLKRRSERRKVFNAASRNRCGVTLRGQRMAAGDAAAGQTS